MNRTQRTVLVAAAMTGIVAGCMLGSGCAKSSDNTVTNAPGTNAPTGDAGQARLPRQEQLQRPGRLQDAATKVAKARIPAQARAAAKQGQLQSGLNDELNSEGETCIVSLSDF